MKRRQADSQSNRMPLGSLARDTKGDFGPHWEASGLQRNVGLSRD